MTARQREIHRERRWEAAAAAAVAVALVIRILHAFFTERFNPLAGDLQLDAATYDRWARAISSGGDAGPTTLMQSPLYPWFLSLLYRIFGPSLAAVRYAQAALGAATCALVVSSARRLFESWAAAAVAGVLVALYAPLIFYEGVLVPATLIVFLNALFVAVLAGGAGPPPARRLVAAGIILGLAIVANPMSAVIIPFVALHLAVASPRTVRTVARRWLAAAAGLVLALAPFTARNALRTGELIPLTTGGGINFYIGNNANANGFYAVPSYLGRSLGGTPEEQSIAMQTLASEVAGTRLSQSETSRFWLRAGLDYIRSEPRRWGALLWDKFRFFWNDYERANVESFYFHRRFPGVLRLPLATFGFLMPLGLIGLFLTRSRSRRLWLLYGGVLTYLLGALVFYVLARYRLPVVVFLAPFAGAAAVELVRLASSRRFAELALSLAALALLAFFSNARVARDTPIGVSGNLTRLGNAYVARGDTTKAVGAYREALERNPRNEAARAALSRLKAE